jgi:hypothetical protein
VEGTVGKNPMTARTARAVSLEDLLKVPVKRVREKIKQKINPGGQGNLENLGSLPIQKMAIRTIR